jgi:hypothetical protein
MGALLASAMRTPEPVAEKKITTAQEKNQSTAEVDTEGAAGQTPEQKSEGPKNETESANLGKGAVDRTQKNQDPQTIS